MTTTITPRGPGAIRRRLNHVPAGLLGCGVVLAGGLVIGGLTRGVPGVVGVAIGVVGVAVSYVLSGLAVAWADSINPQLTMPVGLATYAIKFSLLGILLIAFGGSNWAGLHPMAFAIIAAVIGWNAAHLWWITHTHIPYVQVGPNP
ncbi:hypothetical protein ACNTMW_27300 [Planosporangium sp. 12N6]|uniref:hypothetical protein n=1 Tax=Planosporangium spinosum TaxID=3402278 RepID=UPI003CE765F7